LQHTVFKQFCILRLQSRQRIGEAFGEVKTYSHGVPHFSAFGGHFQSLPLVPTETH
jgi:hypothetical protein